MFRQTVAEYVQEQTGIAPSEGDMEIFMDGLEEWYDKYQEKELQCPINIPLESQ